MRRLIETGRGRIFAAAIMALVGIGVAVALINRGGSSTAPSSNREARLQATLASQGITFTPATQADRSQTRVSPRQAVREWLSTLGKTAQRRAAVYLVELREVRAPSLGPHGAWAVVERGSTYPNAGPPIDRLAYVVQLRDVRRCRVEISCLSEKNPRLQEWDAFVDARTGTGIQAIGFPKGHSDGTERSATIVGGIIYSGGPVSPTTQGRPGGIHQREPGRVIVRNARGHRVAAERVRRGRRFRFDVAPGRYELIAHTDRARCRRSVDAQANRTTRASVVCSIP